MCSRFILCDKQACDANVHLEGAVTPLPSAQQKACQSPKPILLNTVCFRPDVLKIMTNDTTSHDQGSAHTPYDWSPATVDVQMLRVGNFGGSPTCSPSSRLTLAID